MRRLLTLLAMTALGGCATVQHGPLQRIQVDSEPQSALVRTQDCGVGSTKEVRTPGTVWVSRRSDHCTLVFTASNYWTERVTLHRAVSDEFIDNIDIVAEVADATPGEFLTGLFLGGLFAGTGFAVDGATGAMFEQQPHRVFVALVSRDAPPPDAEPEQSADARSADDGAPPPPRP